MSTTYSPFRNPLIQLFIPGLKGLKLYWLPFLLIQAAGALIVFAYYHSGTFQSLCNDVAEWKTRGGIWTSALFAAIFWGLLPEALKAATGRGRPWSLATLGELVFLFCFFGGNGVLTHLFYGVQIQIFGDATDFKTVTSKMLFDQFVFTPFIVYIYTVLLFTWKEQDFQLFATVKKLSFKLYMNRVKPLLFLGWLYWFPMTACIYSMPSALQVPLNICIAAAWVMLVVFILEACETQELQRAAGSPPR